MIIWEFPNLGKLESLPDKSYLSLHWFIIEIKDLKNSSTLASPNEILIFSESLNSMASRLHSGEPIEF